MKTYDEARERIENIELAMGICKQVTDFLDKMENEQNLNMTEERVVGNLRFEVSTYLRGVMNGEKLL